MARLIRRRVEAAVVVDAKDEARALIAEAEERAQAIEAAAEESAERVRSEARAAGEEQGRARAAAALVEAEHARSAMLDEAERGLVQLAMVAAERVLGEVLTEDRTRMSARIRHLLSETKASGSVRVHVADPFTLTGVDAAVIEDPTLGPGDAIVEARGARFDARLHVQLDALRRAIEDSGS
ncbi:MAG: FliH/SctL family protein [Myxococcota bacterium]